jgi:hypothetical protein
MSPPDVNRSGCGRAAERVHRAHGDRRPAADRPHGTVGTVIAGTLVMSALIDQFGLPGRERVSDTAP